MASTLLRGATVIDGTGQPGYFADVLVSDRTITAVRADIDAADIDAGVDEIDLTGLVLAPGFIDIHTHLDAQILWDPDVTPSSWHGVTTVLMGNCGLGLAPVHADDRDDV